MKIQDVRPGETHKPFVLNLFIGLSLLAVISCNNDCRKDHSCVPEYYEFHVDSVKQYFPGKPGSYWVYKNTVNGEIDTVLCLGNYIDTITDKGDYDFSYNVTVRYERLYFVAYSSFSKITSYYSSSAVYADEKGLEAYNKNISNVLKQNVLGTSNCLFFPLDPQKRIGFSDRPSKFLGDTVLLLQAKTYPSLQRFYVGFDGTWELQKNRQVTYYWARGIGLVKRRSDDGKANWELMDYKIID